MKALSLKVRTRVHHKIKAIQGALGPLRSIFASLSLTADQDLGISKHIDPSQGPLTWKHSAPQANHFLTGPTFTNCPSQTSFIYSSLSYSAQFWTMRKLISKFMEPGFKHRPMWPICFCGFVTGSKDLQTEFALRRS